MCVDRGRWALLQIIYGNAYPFLKDSDVYLIEFIESYDGQGVDDLLGVSSRFGQLAALVGKIDHGVFGALLLENF